MHIQHTAVSKKDGLNVTKYTLADFSDYLLLGNTNTVVDTLLSTIKRLELDDKLGALIQSISHQVSMRFTGIEVSNRTTFDIKDVGEVVVTVKNSPLKHNEFTLYVHLKDYSGVVITLFNVGLILEMYIKHILLNRLEVWSISNIVVERSGGATVWINGIDSVTKSTLVNYPLGETEDDELIRRVMAVTNEFTVTTEEV